MAHYEEVKQSCQNAREFFAQHSATGVSEISSYVVDQVDILHSVLQLKAPVRADSLAVSTHSSSEENASLCLMDAPMRTEDLVRSRRISRQLSHLAINEPKILKKTQTLQESGYLSKHGINQDSQDELVKPINFYHQQQE